MGLLWEVLATFTCYIACKEIKSLKQRAINYEMQCVQSDPQWFDNETECVDSDPQWFDNETQCVDDKTQRVEILTQCIDNEMQCIYNALTTSCNTFSRDNAFAMTFLMPSFRK